MTERDVFDKRYGEILLVMADTSGPQATVYGTFPLNDCPSSLWEKLDAQSIAAEHGAVAALLNGPRHWLVTNIDKVPEKQRETATFGDLEMIRLATVRMASMNPGPYLVNRVDRRTVFVFGAGRPVFELVDPHGQRWVMQSYNLATDPSLTVDALAGLAEHLQLPDGWRYETRVLTEPLRVDTTTRDATVTQDDLGNSYSLQV